MKSHFEHENRAVSTAQRRSKEVQEVARGHHVEAIHSVTVLELALASPILLIFSAAPLLRPAGDRSSRVSRWVPKFVANVSPMRFRKELGSV
jgi:hypothetical protein